MRCDGRHAPHGFLFWRIYGHGLVLLVLVALAITAVAWGLRGRLLPRQPERMALYVAARIAEHDQSPEAIDEELRELHEGLGIETTVFGPAGEVRASVGERAEPLAPGVVASLGKGALFVEGRHFTIAAQLPRQDGYVVVTAGPRGRSWARTAVFLAAVLFVLAIGSWPTARSIAAPLERLTAVANRIGEGDLSARSGLRSRGEVGELARALDDMAERLQRLVRAERELLANVSHELRTPLARIRVALELAAEGDHEKARRYIAEIGDDLAEIDGLVEEILTASRLAGAGPGGLPVHRAPTALGALLEEVAGRFRAADPGRPLELTAAPGLPAVEADAPLLRRLIDNLLDNARKYSEPGTPVALSARAEPGQVVLEVRDRGIGIDPEDLPRLFTPFFRTDRSRARGTGGVGLGLTLAKRIAEAHGGTIAAESRPGEGTTIRVVLPAK